MPQVLIAQFLSALADNMLLFVILGLMKQQLYPDWVAPVLQQTFLISYIVLAPFVGGIADGFPKGKVMLISNTIKFFAVILLLSGLSPFVCYTLVGIGACMYSPAKYGILKELKGETFLVKANAIIEGSTIAAILIGVVAGGFLADIATENNSFGLVIGAIAFVYLLATISNLFIPKLAPLHSSGVQPISIMIKQFITDFKKLYSDFPTSVTLLGTGLFFGVGATMRFLLIAWVPEALGITDNKTPANLNAVVAVGIVIGSILASRIPLEKAQKVLSAGVGMGIFAVILTFTNSISWAYIWLIMIGICGGLFLIPLNALLQKRGHELVGGGHAVAVQNFTENIIMLVMLMLYMFFVKIGVSISIIGIGFGVTIMLLMLALRLYSNKQPMS